LSSLPVREGTPAALPGRRARSAIGAQADLELAKWAALLTMAIDHYGKIVEPDLFLATHAVGRLSFPLFAAIVGTRLALRPDLASRYARRLLPWALVSQPAFVLAGRPWHDGNILFTLLLGVGLSAWLRRAREGTSTWSEAAVVVLVAPLTLFVEFGPIGVALVPITAALAARSRAAALWAAGPLGVAANLSPELPPLDWVDLCAFGSSVILFASVALEPRLPRLPTHAFYAFYPLHLLALHFYDLYG
jgi:hypothetical protein